MTAPVDPSYPGIALISLVGAAVGAFFGAYFKKKGENLATHEDLGKLVEQMAAVTEATKSIEATISDEVWDRQRQWEMKRDALLDVVRAIGRLDNALVELYSACNAPAPAEDESKLAFSNNQNTKRANWNTESAKFDGARFLANVFGGNELEKALAACVNLMREVSIEVMSGKPERYMASQKDVVLKMEIVCLAFRKELRLGEEQ